MEYQGPITGTIVALDNSDRFRPVHIVNYDFDGEHFHMRFPFDNLSGDFHKGKNRIGARLTFHRSLHTKPKRNAERSYSPLPDYYSSKSCDLGQFKLAYSSHTSPQQGDEPSSRT